MDVPSVGKAKARLASTHRLHKDDPEAIHTATQEYYTAKIAADVQRSLDKAPPLSPEQRRLLAGLFDGVEQ